MSKSAGTKQIARNRKAFHDYEVLEQVEAGIVLQGSEVKSLRNGTVSFNDAHARCRGGEVWLVDLHIPQYANATAQTQRPGQQTGAHTDSQTNQKQFPHWPALSAGS